MARLDKRHLNLLFWCKSIKDHCSLSPWRDSLTIFTDYLFIACSTVRSLFRIRVASTEVTTAPGLFVVLLGQNSTFGSRGCAEIFNFLKCVVILGSLPPYYIIRVWRYLMNGWRREDFSITGILLVSRCSYSLSVSYQSLGHSLPFSIFSSIVCRTHPNGTWDTAEIPRRVLNCLVNSGKCWLQYLKEKKISARRWLSTQLVFWNPRWECQWWLLTLIR